MHILTLYNNGKTYIPVVCCIYICACVCVCVCVRERVCVLCMCVCVCVCVLTYNVPYLLSFLIS